MGVINVSSFFPDIITRENDSLIMNKFLFLFSCYILCYDFLDDSVKSAAKETSWFCQILSNLLFSNHLRSWLETFAP